MEKFEIDYKFVKNTQGVLELEVYIGNPDGDLMPSGNVETSPPPGTLKDPELHYRSIYVREGSTGSNPTKLVFTDTRIYPVGGDMKELKIYCVHEEAGVSVTKKKRRTNVTVHDAGGGK